MGREGRDVRERRVDGVVSWEVGGLFRDGESDLTHLRTGGHGPCPTRGEIKTGSSM